MPGSAARSTSTVPLPTKADDVANKAYVDTVGSIISVIENFIATSAASSKTFTISPAIDMDDVAYLILEIDLAVDGAGSLQMRVNGTTINYFFDGYIIAEGVETLIDGNSQTHFEIMDVALLASDNDTCCGQIKIYLSKAGNKDRINFTSDMVFGGGNLGVQKCGGVQVTAQTEINEIIVLMSANQFQIGTRMTLYKVSR